MTRPRSRSGVTAAAMAPRNTTVKVSAAPATASRLSVGHRPGATANPANAAPHTATVHSIARPCRDTCLTGPENAALDSPPTPMAVVNRPSVRGSPPNRSALIAGNRAAGRPKMVALRSARNAPASTLLLRMKPIPSATARGLGRVAPQRGREADRVDEIAGLQAQVRGHRDNTRKRGTGGQDDLEAEPVQRQPGGQLAGRQQTGRERTAGRAVDGE